MKFNFAKVIRHVPNNTLRILLYRVFCNYKIGDNVRIGFKTFLSCKSVNIEDNVIIGNGNTIVTNTLIVKSHSKIRENNEIRGHGVFELGANSQIADKHYFDTWNSIFIGDNSFVAGRYSEFWTHGSLSNDKQNLAIKIGSNCYISSGVKISPGVKIGSGTLVTLGSVVSSNFLENNQVVRGVPAQVILSDFNWGDFW